MAFLDEFARKVPTTAVAWSFIALVALLVIITILAAIAWHFNKTIVIAGYEFGRPSIGGGAVVAYDLPDGICPKGWIPFKDATSRFIVGAGNKADPDIEKYTTALNLTLREYRNPGGAEQHVLTVEELAPHQHQGTTEHANPASYRVVFDAGNHITDDHVTGYQGGNVRDAINRMLPGSNHDHNFSTNTGKDVLGEPHNNMPPYIALYFCKKEG